MQRSRRGDFMGLLAKIRDKISGRVPIGMKRSDKWPEVRNEYIRKHPKCAVCDSTKKVEAHHVIPFHIDPSLELDPKNLISLCRSKRLGFNCHWLFGHLNDWKNQNIDVRKDSRDWREKLLYIILRKDK